jgi:hypothetical protein
MVTTQVAVVLVHAPLHPTNAEPVAGVAVNVTEVPAVKVALQRVPQLMLVGALVTVPVPVPLFPTVSVYVGARLKVAVTVLAVEMATVQVPDALAHAPLQPAKREPAVGVAVKVTLVPIENTAAQLAPQSMPARSLVTVPLPVPPLVTVRAAVVRSPVVKLSVLVARGLPARSMKWPLARGTGLSVSV